MTQTLITNDKTVNNTATTTWTNQPINYEEQCWRY